jgi:phosphoribosyl 1,2-cyclic phosphodiesterase
MRFRSLGSGSSGNATLVEAGRSGRPSRVLLDCGFSLKELTLRLARAEVEPDGIDALFVTHEHGDHVGCALAFARRHRVPVWMSRGTWRALGNLPEAALADADDPLRGLLNFARDGQEIAVGALRLRPYTVPHDAQEPLQVRFDDGDRALGVLTDAGCATDHIRQHLAGCAALLLECNHDPALLAASVYPASVKARIGGRLGHLSNGTAAAILAASTHAALRHVMAAHLSERNNSPALARGALAEACGAAPDEVLVADPQTGSDWIALV